MPKAPDWLLQMTDKADGLVDDSPQFRQVEQAGQKANLTKASMEALQQMRQRNIEQQTQGAMQSMQALQGAQQQIDRMTPNQTPTSRTPFFNPNDFREVPPASEFSSNPQVIPPPDLSEPPTTTSPEAEMAAPSDLQGMEGENLAQTVQQIADVTGLSPQVVAMMSLLGKDIAQSEQEGTATYSPEPLAPPPPTPIPQMPNFGIGAPPSPLNSTPLLQ